MPHTFSLQLERQISSPKNWNATRVDHQIHGRFALVGENLWDLQELKTIAGIWGGIHPYKAIGLKQNDAVGGAMDLCSLPESKAMVHFDKKVYLELSPYGPFATFRLPKDNDESGYRGKVGSKVAMPIYSIESGKCLFTIEDSCVLGIFLPEDRLAFIDTVGKISIYDLNNGQLVTKLKGLERKPLHVRLDQNGKKLLVYGVHWKRGEAAYKIWDTGNMELLSEYTGEWKALGKHINFYDGVNIIGDNAIVDTEKNVMYESWLGVHYGSPHVASLTSLFQGSHCATIVSRDPLSIKSSLEIWDIKSKTCVCSIDPGKRPSVVIPVLDDQLAVFHSMGARPLYDDSADPALSIYKILQ